MSPPSVLLVNGSSDERELYEWGLHRHGFVVRSVDDLSDIAAALNLEPSDALVLSLRLGDEHTWHLLEQLQCGAAVGVPAILLTGSIRPDAANRHRAQLTGCAAFVAKPCTPDALARILRAVIAGARGLVITDPAGFSASHGASDRGSTRMIGP